MAERLKGQDVELILVAGGQPQTTITTIKNFDFAHQFEILREGYLGQTTDQRDYVFKGIAGKFDLHIVDQRPLVLLRNITDKARRRLPGFQVNIKVTLNIPNGDRPRVIIPSCAFGDYPFSAPSRSDFAMFSVNYEAAEAQTLLS